MRYVVVGSSGSGKTTLARNLAGVLEAAHVELDALHWEPNWRPAALDVFRARVDAATQGERWVVDGNYSKVRDIVWARATHLVWLDYRFPLVFGRVLRRTLGRALSRQVLWNGNRESLRLLLSRDSLLWWVIKTYRRRRREYPAVLAQEPYAHLRVERFRSPKQTDAWLASLASRQARN